MTPAPGRPGLFLLVAAAENTHMESAIRCRSVLTRALVLACACALLTPRDGVAQEVSTDDAAVAMAEALAKKNAKREPTRLYVAMWTTHLKNKFVRLDNNWVGGVSSHGWFGATFLNSFDRRAFTGGIQRTVTASAPRPVRASLGYRLGFVTGYDERFVKLARRTPVLPLAQPYFLLDVSHVGIEVQYTFIVVSTALSYRF